jgi:hypothetical protein
VGGGDASRFYAFSLNWLRLSVGCCTLFNLRLPFTPAAIAVPTTLTQVQTAFKCGFQDDLKIKPKPGGYSYTAHALGGEAGYLMIDLKYWNSVIVENTTRIAPVTPAGR